MTLEVDLAGAEWSERRRRYVALGTLLAATAAASFLVLSVVNGLEGSIGEELSQTLGSDLRIARSHTGLGDGDLIQDLPDALAGLRFADPRASFAPRLETQAIFQQGSDFTSGRPVQQSARSAAVLVGIDPAADATVANVDGLVVRGLDTSAFSRDWRTPDGARLVPIIVGDTFLDAAGPVVAGDEFSWEAIYNISAGHIENNELVRERAVVVGRYETGFRMVDRLVVYAPRGDVARLLGHFPTNPPATVILADSPSPERLAARAADLGYESVGADDFRAFYLGPVFASVRVAAWAIVGLLSLMTAGWMGYSLAHHVHEDRRKIATLRAVGVPDRTIARTYLLLGGALAVAASVAGVAAAALLSGLAAIVSALAGTIAPKPSLLEALVLVGLSLLAGVLTVRWAVARATRVSIREALTAP